MQASHFLQKAGQELAQGRLGEARALYRSALTQEVDPSGRAEACKGLGLIALQSGQASEAVEWLSQAISLGADDSTVLVNLGVAYKISGQPEQAIRYFTQVSSSDSGYGAAQFNLGLTWTTLGDSQKALSCFDQVVVRHPQAPEPHFNRGKLLEELSQPHAALEAYGTALTLRPQWAEALHSRAMLYRQLDRLNEALADIQDALITAPEDVGILTNAGLIALETGLAEQAIEWLNRALTQNARHIPALFNKAEALKKLHAYEKALQTYDAVLALKADLIAAWNNKAQLLQSLQRTEASLECLNRVIELDPAYPFIRGELAYAYMRLCDWQRSEPLRAAVLEAVPQHSSASPCLPVLAMTDCVQTQRLAAEQWVARTLPAPGDPLPPRIQLEDSRIKIGYFSPDFRQHPVAWLTAELFTLHDRAEFEVWAFDLSRHPKDEITQRIAGSVDHWVECGSLSDEQILQMARSAGLAIAIDLAGHTQAGRPQLYIRRLAPVQVQYLGYPGTWGSSAIDYLLADHYTVPPDSRDGYHESVVYLPCFQINDRQREIAPEPLSRADCGLPEHAFVYCCFNNSFKITPELFADWMEILKAVPRCVLWLYETHSKVRMHFQQIAQDHGVSAERLVFARKQPSSIYLRQYALADVFLDTFPFNAGTTASDALRMGLPVITRSGQAFASRMAGSLLQAAGLSDLISSDGANYVSLAVRAGLDTSWMLEIRARLRAGLTHCAWLDTPGQVKHLETAYRAMLDRAEAGLSPADLDLSVLGTSPAS